MPSSLRQLWLTHFKGLAVVLLAVGLIAASGFTRAGSAVAQHSVHSQRLDLNRTEKVVLPGGVPVEVGLVGSETNSAYDWVRVVVLDKERRLLALSKRSRFLRLTCDSPKTHCTAYDGLHVYDLDPKTFSLGEVVPESLGYGADKFSELKAAGSRGFSRRLPTPTEVIQAEREMLAAWPWVYAMLPGLGAAMVASLIGVRRPREGGILSLLVLVANVCLRLPLLLGLLLVTGLLIYHLPTIGPLMALATGGAVVQLLRLWLRRKRRPAATWTPGVSSG